MFISLLKRDRNLRSWVQDTLRAVEEMTLFKSDQVIVVLFRGEIQCFSMETGFSIQGKLVPAHHDPFGRKVFLDLRNCISSVMENTCS